MAEAVPDTANSKRHVTRHGARLLTIVLPSNPLQGQAGRLPLGRGLDLEELGSMHAERRCEQIRRKLLDPVVQVANGPVVVAAGVLDLLLDLHEIVMQLAEVRVRPELRVGLDEQCESWEVSNGGNTFRFVLRDNIQWQDGNPLTAADVVYSMQRYGDLSGPSGRSGLSVRNLPSPWRVGSSRVPIPRVQTQGDSGSASSRIQATPMTALPVDLYSYMRTNPTYPDQSTADQFFDERQFEAYRELGYQVGKQVCTGTNRKNIDEFFDAAKRQEKKILGGDSQS